MQIQAPGFTSAPRKSDCLPGHQDTLFSWVLKFRELMRLFVNTQKPILLLAVKTRLRSEGVLLATLIPQSQLPNWPHCIMNENCWDSVQIPAHSIYDALVKRKSSRSKEADLEINHQPTWLRIKFSRKKAVSSPSQSPFITALLFCLSMADKMKPLIPSSVSAKVLQQP